MEGLTKICDFTSVLVICYVINGRLSEDRQQAVTKMQDKLKKILLPYRNQILRNLNKYLVLCLN